MLRLSRHVLLKALTTGEMPSAGFTSPALRQWINCNSGQICSVPLFLVWKSLRGPMALYLTGEYNPFCSFVSPMLWYKADRTSMSARTEKSLLSRPLHVNTPGSRNGRRYRLKRGGSRWARFGTSGIAINGFADCLQLNDFS